VPAAVGHLLAKEPTDDALRIFTEVRAERGHAAVDARLDLADKERVVIEPMPYHALADQSHRVPRLRGCGVDPHVAQPGQCDEAGPRQAQGATVRPRIPPPIRRD